MKGIQNTTTSNFGSLIGNSRKYIVPKFQRDYSWEEEQWDDLWQDIEQMRETSGDHYMGYLVLQTSDNKDHCIIDGQQRITTITLIILAAIKAIKRLSEKGIETEKNDVRVEVLLRDYIGTKDPITLEYENLLVLNRNNNGYYRDYIVKLGELRTRNTSLTERRMKKCFEWYEVRLRNKFETGVNYAQFITDVVNNLFFTIITVSDDMNAFRVFETLNARGVQLSSSDLLKNYLFSLVDDEFTHPSRIEQLEEKWTGLTSNVKAEKLPDFIRYYWNSKHKTVRSSDLFKAIRGDIRTATDVFTLLNEMISYSDIYMALKNCIDEYWGNNNEIRKNIQLLDIFNLKQPYSLLMAANKHLSTDVFEKVLGDVIKVCFRYSTICGKNPNDIERVFNDIAVMISNNGCYDRSLLKKIYIEDEEFEEMFKYKSFQMTTRNAKVVKYILGKLDRYAGSQREINLYGDTESIEHIMPQNPDENVWKIDEEEVSGLTYRLGNLCLLERDANRKLGNVGYDEKKSEYEKSTFKETSKIPQEYARWDKHAINVRQSKMATIAKSIWRIDF